MVYSNKFVMCVLVDGKPVKELANGEVQIPFNTEYVLRFRNKNDRRAVVKFWIDGELVSGAGGYVIPANDHIDIKRHNNRDAAFVLVPLDSAEAVDAGKNGPNYDKQKGVVKAEFTLEKKYEPVREIHHHHNHYYPRTRRVSPPIYPNPWRPYEPLWLNDQSVTCGGPEVHNGGMTSDYSMGDKVRSMSSGLSYNSLASSAGAEMSCHAAPSEDIAQFKRISMPSVSSPAVQDGCTVEGTATGQRFGTTYVDLEDTSTTLQIFLRGYDVGYEFPETRRVERPVRRREETVDLESENERLKQEIADAKKKKSLEEENERLRRELEKYTG